MAAREKQTTTARAGRKRGPSDVIAQETPDCIASAANDATSGNLLNPGNEDAMRAEIALAAYYNAERRGFGGNRELDDWLEAERDILEKAGQIERAR